MIYNSNLHMFPEQCVKYLKEKFHLGELNIRELMYVMKRIGIKTFKVHTNSGVYDIFLRRDVNGVQDFEFINTLVQYRKEKRIKDEWSKEPMSDYTPEMSNMKNASDDLLKNDDKYFKNENRKFMKQDKKKLYESIMASVAKEVKKALNEGEISSNDEVTLYAGQLLHGILNYKDKKIKIEKLDTKAGNTFFSYYIKGQGLQHGFLLNGEQSKIAPYYWVDKDGIEHNTKDEWVKNATYIMDDQGNKVIGIEWRKINVRDTIIGCIKKWYELT